MQVDPHHIHNMKRNVPPPSQFNVQLPQKEEVKYLGLHLDRRLTWHKHIFVKGKQQGITLIKMYWLLRRKSKLSTSNKLLIYKAILKPIRIYRIQLWGTASTSNIEILQCFQLKTLHTIVDAHLLMPNSVNRRDLQIPTVKEEIRRYNLNTVLASVHTQMT
jgi:hypothetical protein